MPACGTSRSRRRTRDGAVRRVAPARFEVLAPPPADGSTRARLGRADAAPRRRRDAAVHAGRHERDGQGARRPTTSARRRRHDHPLEHLPPLPAPRRTSGSRGSAACTGSWTGTGPILTDSGGFQVVSLGDLRVVDEDGVTFRSHLDGSTHRFTPEHAIAVQEALGVGHRGRLRPAGLPDARRAPSSPTRPRGRTAGRSARSRRTRAPDQALFGIVQGGLDPELRAASTRFIAEPAVRRHLHRRPGRRRDARAARRDARRRGPAARRRSAAALPDGPRLAGGPARGRPPRRRPVRFVLPARVARNGQLWVPGGRLNIRNQAFLDDPRPIQDDCPCLACRRFSRAYLAHLFRAKELLAYRLATCHNLTFTLDFMARIRASHPGRNLPRLDGRAACSRGPDERR